MKVLTVKTKPPYDIIIASGLLETIPTDLKKSFDFGKVAIVTDNQVKTLYGERLLENLQKSGVKADLFSFPEGERSKNIETVVSLSRSLVRAGFDRKDLIIALGGGVVGDIAGFLASIYLRGIPYVQVPTTLLAQVDSSVGGKTGVDLPEGKNLLGTFYQPKKVYIDTEVLSTLPKQEIKNGLAEIVKYACIMKRSLFKYLEKLGSDLYNLPQEPLQFLIYQSCKLKAQVVSKDEREGGLRRILNFGHTVGHVFESLSNYQIPHGFAVTVGMVVEAKLSELVGVAQEKVYQPLINLLTKLELPHRISHLFSQDIDRSRFFETLSRDKKVWKGTLTLVLLQKIGKFVFYENPQPELINKALEECY